MRRLLILGCAAVLAIAAPAAAAPLTRLLPPPDGQSYFGFTYRLWDSADARWGDTRPFAERIGDAISHELGGKTPTFITVWATWQQPAASGKPFVSFSESSDFRARAQSVTARDRLYLDWNITQTTAATGGITTKDIAAGKVDAYIRAFAREVKAYGRPVLLRLLNGEYNGSWWYGVSPLANPNLTKADFIDAWRHVVGVFREVGALNVSWAWVVVTPPPLPLDWGFDRAFDAYYPGDEYVDWVGADTSDLLAPSALDPIYDFAVAHSKPFFVSEFALRHQGSTLSPAGDEAWLNGMFDYVEAHPQIKAINYFNYNSRPDLGGPFDPSRLVYLDGGRVSYQSGVADDDSRLIAESGANFRGTFARRISSPRYVSSFVTRVVPAATFLMPKADRGFATFRWRGNGTATAYDVESRQGAGSWSPRLAKARLTKLVVRARRGTRITLRIRAYDTSGFAGLWTTSPAARVR